MHNQAMKSQTALALPPLIFGSSALGNLYEKIDRSTKQRIVDEWFSRAPGVVCIDSAGKYGAGLALEEIGIALRARDVAPDQFLFSNKLGWMRVPLTHDEPQLEQGIWKGIAHDAVQAISYDGILECWRQGNELLGEPYKTDLLSVHDPDEYLADAKNAKERESRFSDVLAAYRALAELRDGGKAKAIGVGAKDWRVIHELADQVEFDWVMFAGSLTIYSHPDELLMFVRELASRSVAVINSAVFHSGFLVGGSYFDYRPVSRDRDGELFAWRDEFRSICTHHDVRPADACVEFGRAASGVMSIALNTGKPERVADNVRSVNSKAPSSFWRDLKIAGLVSYVPEEMR